MLRSEMDPVESALITLDDAKDLVNFAHTKVVLALAKVVPKDGSKLRLPKDLTDALWRLYQLSPQSRNEAGFTGFLLALLPPWSNAVVTFDFYWNVDESTTPCSRPSDIVISPVPVTTK